MVIHTPVSLQLFLSLTHLSFPFSRLKTSIISHVVSFQKYCPTPPVSDGLLGFAFLSCTVSPADES